MGLNISDLWEGWGVQPSHSCFFEAGAYSLDPKGGNPAQQVPIPYINNYNK